MASITALSISSEVISFADGKFTLGGVPAPKNIGGILLTKRCIAKPVRIDAIRTQTLVPLPKTKRMLEQFL